MLCRRLVDKQLAPHVRTVVDTKTHRRRREWESKTYPRSQTEEPNRLPRRGHRGGWMREPQRGVAKLDGTNLAQQAWWSKRAGDLRNSFVGKVLQHPSDPSGNKLQDLFDSHLAELDSLSVQMPSADEFRLPHVKKLSLTPKPNPLHAGLPLSSMPVPSDPPFVQESLHVRQSRRGRFLREDLRTSPTINAYLESEDRPVHIVPEIDPEDAQAAGWAEAGAARSSGRQSARRQRMKETESAPQETSSKWPSERTTALSSLWAQLGASWASLNDCVIPSTFPETPRSSVSSMEREDEKERRFVGPTVEAYKHTRVAASLFDVSYKVCLRVIGVDREFVADQFLTCHLRGMGVGDVQYACVLDTKGLVLDDAFVCVTEESIEIMASGCQSGHLVDYLGQYITYVRRSGADVDMKLSPHKVVLALQGPKALQALQEALSFPTSPWLATLHIEPVPVQPHWLSNMPYMSALSLSVGSVACPVAAEGFLMRVGTTGEDGFEISAAPGDMIQHLVEALLAHEAVKPAGVYCLDMLRMEAGIPRVGSDIPTGTVSPIRASLTWLLDQKKMRNHMMFGWRQLFTQLAKGPRFRRVSLLLDGPAFAGCRLLSNPHRQPIGQITSTAWSPTLECRVAMAYVKPEYARANKHILVTVPYNLPTHKMRKRAIKKWTKMGPALRSAYRSLVPACVMPLPIVPHRYPATDDERRRERSHVGVKGAREPWAGSMLPAVEHSVKWKRPHTKPRHACPADSSDLASI